MQDVLTGGEVGLHGFTDGNGELVGELVREFGKETTAIVGENAAPETVHVDRDDGGFGAFGDEFHAATDGGEAAGAGELTFREDADEVAVGDTVGGVANGFARILDGNRYRVKNLEDRTDETGHSKLFFDDETDWAGADHREEEGIGKGDVVADEEGTATLRDALRVQDAGAIEKTQNPDTNQTDESLGDESQGGHHDDRTEEEEDEILSLWRGTESVHDPHETHGKEPHEVIEEVACRNDIASISGVAVVLEESIEGDEINCPESPGEGEEDVGGRPCDVRQGEHESAEGDTDSSERDETEFVFAFAEEGRKGTADDHTAAEPSHEDTAGETEVGIGLNLHVLGDLDKDEEETAG